MTSKKVCYVVGPTFGFQTYLSRAGYDYLLDRDFTDGRTPKFDIIAFMGGTDIETTLYGEQPLAQTQQPDTRRDKKEIALYKTYEHLPKFGICRGAQLLNVLNGGSLYQHVTGHTYGNHDIVDIYGTRVSSSSVHHQMMIPAPNSTVIAWSEPLTQFRFREKAAEAAGEFDPEVLWIKEKRELLVQGHPEFGPDQFTDYFFNLADRLIWSSYHEKAAA